MDINRVIKVGKNLNNLYLKNHHFHFIAIPKCANTTIKISITFTLDLIDESQKMAVTNRPQLIHKILKTPFNPNEKKNLIEFAIVRDPIERFKSFYKDKILGNGWPNNTRKKFMEAYNLLPEEDVNDFIDKIVNIPDKFSEIHFRSQYYIINQSRISNEIKLFNFKDFNKIKSFLEIIVLNKFKKKLINLGHFQKSQSCLLNISENSLIKLKQNLFKKH